MLSSHAISARACRIAACWGTPIDTVSYLPLEARGLAEMWCHSLLRDPKEAELLRAEQGLALSTFLTPRIGATRRYSEFWIKPVGGSDHSRQICCSHSRQFRCCQEKGTTPGHYDTRSVNMLFRECQQVLVHVGSLSDFQEIAALYDRRDAIPLVSCAPQHALSVDNCVRTSLRHSLISPCPAADGAGGHAGGLPLCTSR